MTMLASGSRGNSAVLSSSDTSILIDAGLSCRETLKRMHSAGEDPLALKGVVITHEHQDHVNGLAVLARKLRIPIYMTEPTHHAWKRWYRATAPRRSDGSKADAKLEQLELFNAGEAFYIGDIGITPFTIPHDAADPVGFVFNIEGVRIGYVTDLGYMPTSVRMHLRGCDGLVIESNHDIEMLRNGSYPWAVKQRVMSRTGHLSNEELGKFLSTDYDGGAAFIVLAHLSENNNHPDVALASAETALNPRRSLLHANLIRLAAQDAPLESITL